MNEHLPDSVTNQRPKWKQLAWMIGGGIVLAVGGCGFFLADFNSWGGNIGAITFVIGVLLFLAGCVRCLYIFFTRSNDN
jgi:uncharacterized membrane protein HdeD (DUF308 family)